MSPRSLPIAAFLGVMVASAAFTPAVADGEAVVDRAAESGIDITATPTWDVCDGDWDGDGRGDFFVSRHMLYAGALFTQGDNGSFVRKLAGVIAPKVVRRTEPRHTGVDRHGCVMADFDQNGLMDLYTSAGRYMSNRVKHGEIDNELFMQVAPGVVEDWATSIGVNEPCQRGRHVVASDLNGDGWADLFVGAQLERADSTDACNTFIGYPYIEQAHVYINQGRNDGGSWAGFREGREFNVSVANTGNALALEWDQNRDGKPDLLSLDFKDRRPKLYRNSGSSFTEVSQLSTIQLPRMNSADIGDVTGDGIVDLIYADNAGFAYRAGTATGISTTTVRIGFVPSAADGWRVALGDANGDGTMDVYGQTSPGSGATANPVDVLYVNGGATRFTPLSVPAPVGASNDVESVMVEGVAQFIVLNGGNEEKEVQGSLQLIALERIAP